MIAEPIGSRYLVYFSVAYERKAMKNNDKQIVMIIVLKWLYNGPLIDDYMSTIR